MTAFIYSKTNLVIFNTRFMEHNLTGLFLERKDAITHSNSCGHYSVVWYRFILTIFVE